MTNKHKKILSFVLFYCYRQLFKSIVGNSIEGKKNHPANKIEINLILFAFVRLYRKKNVLNCLPSLHFRFT